MKQSRAYFAVMRRGLLGTIGLLLVQLAITAPALAQAGGEGVVSPESPAGVEYALPDVRARRETADAGSREGGKTPSLFGAGIKQAAASGAGRSPGQRASKGKRRGDPSSAPTGQPDQSTAGRASSKSSRTSGGRRSERSPIDAPAAVDLTDDSIGPGRLMAGIGLLALVLGGALAYLLRRRSRGSPDGA